MKWPNVTLVRFPALREVARYVVQAQERPHLDHRVRPRGQAGRRAEGRLARPAGGVRRAGARLSRRRTPGSTCSSGSSSATMRRASGRAASARRPALRSRRSRGSAPRRVGRCAERPLQGRGRERRAAVPCRCASRRRTTGDTSASTCGSCCAAGKLVERAAGGDARAGHHRPVPAGGLQAREGQDVHRRAWTRTSATAAPPHASSRSSRASSRRTRAHPAVYDRGMSATVRVGTCSWADETLTKVWYPKGVRSGEARIRHYAERFDTVEANSTYYRPPGRRAGGELGRADTRGVHDAREGVRADDAAPGQARVAARGPARRDAGRRAGPGRPAAAGAARRGLPPLPPGRSSRCASAASSAASCSSSRPTSSTSRSRSSTSSGRSSSSTATSRSSSSATGAGSTRRTVSRRSRSSSRSARRT